MNIFAKRKQAVMLTVLLFTLNYAIDRITKLLAVRFLKDNEPIVLLHKLIVFTYTENSGAFLSMGKSWNIYIKYFVLLIIPIIVCILIALHLMIKENNIYRIVTGSCILGGGAGNLIDRLCNQFKVIDFMNFGIGNVRTGILNMADISVTFGAILLLIFELSSGSPHVKKQVRQVKEPHRQANDAGRRSNGAR
ncbi:MAG: signal peptidase II [Spirochaetaceae bacterium]|jgi:signal peptidase II|nr:signal peptidase II [Spirochaetaceae bacterium]